MKPTVFYGCVVCIFLYLGLGACSSPDDLIVPTHFTRVPPLTNLQATLDTSSTGKRRVTVRWEFDTSNANLRSWDVLRNIQDTTSALFKELETVKRPVRGFPVYVDSSAALREFGGDSIFVYYRFIPNGSDNFQGPISDILQILIRKIL